MSRPIIEVSGISKRYALGEFGFSSFREETEKWVRRLRGRAPEATLPATPAEREFWALRDVSFSIQPGEVVGIIGRNGAGKSTLLKILSRITEPTSGEAVLRGRVASLLEVGTGFHPELSGRDNVFLNGAILGMKRPEIAAKLDEIIAFAEIERFIGTPVKRYSSGMYVKLAFAVAAHLEPEILIIDEVLAVGDAQFQRKCIGRMQEIAQGHGRTVLFVSHAMTTIRRLCQRCVVLEGGRLRGIYPAEEAIDHYNRDAGASDLDVDTDPLPRAWGSTGEEARLVRIRALGDRGLLFGEPLELEFTIRVRSTIDAGMIGIAFNTVEGSRVMTLDSDADGRTLRLAPGLHTVTLSLPSLPLSPGRYYCHAAIGQGRHMCDIVDNFALWEVHPGGRNDWESDRAFGGCRLRAVVHHRPASA